jgi:hypothetical protein
MKLAPNISHCVAVFFFSIITTWIKSNKLFTSYHRSQTVRTRMQ